jgi:hypothetical protein
MPPVKHVFSRNDYNTKTRKNPLNRGIGLGYFSLKKGSLLAPLLSNLKLYYPTIART